MYISILCLIRSFNEYTGSIGGVLMEKYIKAITGAGVLWFVAMLVIFPRECIDAGMQGIFLCLDTVIPSLFPFFVCSGIITGLGLTKPIEKLMAPFMKPLFGVSGKGAMPFVIGLLSGYPVGAVCISDLYTKGECSKNECEKMLSFCNNSGPLFILGAVGVGMLDSPNLGRWLYIIHILSAIITGMIFKFVKSDAVEVKAIPSGENKDYIKIITDVFANATGNMISVCGYVVFFCVFGLALRKIGVSSVIHGFIEISGGAEEISKLPTLFETRLLWISGVIAFSGLSVILQVVKITQSANLSPRFYIAGKFVQCLISLLLTFFAIKYIPLTHSTAEIEYIAPQPDIWKISIGITTLITVFLLYLGKKTVDN